MKKHPNIFIHIGAYKTGTTFLQKHIFPFWENVKYINDLWLSYIVLLEENKKYIISNETLYGRPWLRNNDLTWTEERRFIIKGLSRLFPDAQILLSLRKHSHFILSLYKQYLHEGGYRSLNEFYDYFQDKGIIKKDDINYMTTIKLLEESFELKPFVFTLEDIQYDLNGLLLKFENLFGIKGPTISVTNWGVVNPGVKYWQAKLLRLLNRIDRKPWQHKRGSLGSLFKNENREIEVGGGLIKLTNNFTLRHGIDPRFLCQEKLKGISKKPIKFDKNHDELINSYYAEDWKKTKDFINTYWA